VPAGVPDGGPSVPGPARAAGSEAAGPHVVTVVDGLQVHLGVSDAPTVSGALDDLGVERGPLDRVVPRPATVLDGATTVRIRRVELVRERVEVAVPRTHVRIEDEELLRGFAELVQPGSDGVRVDTRLVLTVDGELESSLTLEGETLVPAVSRVERVGVATTVDEEVWDALARCEASGRWDAVRHIDGEVAYLGGLQFSPTTWASFKPADFPALASEATREQQILVAERVLARQGWGAWPACSERLGLR